MREIALIVALMGVFVLSLLMTFGKVVKIDNTKDLENLRENTKVMIKGEVSQERVLYEGTKLLNINNFEVICDCIESFKNKNVKVIGIIEKYEDKKQIRALEVEVSN